MTDAYHRWSFADTRVFNSFQVLNCRQTPKKYQITR